MCLLFYIFQKRNWNLERGAIAYIETHGDSLNQKRLLASAGYQLIVALLFIRESKVVELKRKKAYPMELGNIHLNHPTLGH